MNTLPPEFFPECGTSLADQSSVEPVRYNVMSNGQTPRIGKEYVAAAFIPLFQTSAMGFVDSTRGYIRGECRD